MGRDGPLGRPSKERLCEWLNRLGGASGLRLVEPYDSESGHALPFVNRRFWMCEKIDWFIH